MKTYLECIPCIINNGIATAKRLEADESIVENMVKEILVHLSNKDYGSSPPQLVKGMYKIINKHLKTDDPYKEIKKYFNYEFLKLEEDFKDLINKSENKFETALKLAVSGNIIDFGVKAEINKKEVLKHIYEVEGNNLKIDFTKELHESLKTAKSLLYLGDNCGEIVFDKIFIQQIIKEFPFVQICFAVRGNPVINDVTVDDAYGIGLNDIVKIISNGDDAPGTVLESCSPDFKEKFYSADLIISKGQGNYESLSENQRENIYFLFMAKCKVVAEKLDVPLMSLLCKKNKS